MTSADWANKDFYKVLGVAKDASAADIKKAYRKLARANHPDSHPGDTAAEDRFKAIAEAYDVVGDPEKRTQYDDLRSGLGGGFGPFTTSGAGGPQTFDLNDLFGGGTGRSSSGGGFGDVFGGMFGGGGRTRSTAQPRRGSDIETDATIGFAEAIEGVTVSLRLSSDAPCPDCSGTGAKAGTMPRVCPDCEGVGMRAASVGGAFTMNETCPTCRGRGLVVDDPCPTCHGSGRGMSNRTISARIPAGVKDGQRIRLRGKGANGERGGPPGDLYVTVKVSGHPLFGRKARQPDAERPGQLRRGRARRRHQGADAERRAGHAEDPRRHPQRPRLPGPGPRGAAQGRRTRATCWSPSRCRSPPSSTSKARAAVEALRDASGGADLRANLFDARSRPGSTP